QLHLITPAVSSSATPPPPPYPLSLHDALPISPRRLAETPCAILAMSRTGARPRRAASQPNRTVNTTPAAIASHRCLWKVARKSRDRKSTRLNSSHVKISYAVFCLKKKKKRPHA